MNLKSQTSQHEYLMYIHQMNDEEINNKKQQDDTINISDFLPKPRLLSQVLKSAESVRE